MKRRTFIKSVATGAAVAAVAPGVWSSKFGRAWAAGSENEIPVGVLFDLTGSTAVIGGYQKNTAIMAIDEINAAGGINGRKLRAYVADGASTPATYADKSRELILKNKVVSIFGSFTSSSRKAVLPVVDQFKNLYWYPTLWEGRECNTRCIYGGSLPNQTSKLAIPWMFNKFGKRWYLVGSNYIYPKIENATCKLILKQLGGTVVGEDYIPLGSTQFGPIMDKIRAKKPDVIFNMVDGTSVIAMMRQFKAAGFTAKDIPNLSYTTSEVGVAAMGAAYNEGHFSCGSYFQSVDTPANHKFVSAYKARYGQDKVTSFTTEAVYFQVHMFKIAAEKVLKAGKEITPDTLLAAARGVTYQAPEGLVKIDPENDQTWLWPKIGQWQADGQAKVVKASDHSVRPLPYWPLKGTTCTIHGPERVKA